MLQWLMLILVFALAIVFTWSNGVQHASAVAASAIGSHSIEKRQAIFLIFIFEILGTVLGGSAVADAIRSLSGWPEEPSLLPLLASALLSAICWNQISRKFKIPSSTTHALIGGMIGALFAGDFSFQYIKLGEFDPVHPKGVIGAMISLVMSPLLGLVVAYVLFCITLILCLRASTKVESQFKCSQWFLTAALAFGDGQNDTQKTMGLLVLALNAAGLAGGSEIPLWIRLLIGVTMGLGAFWLSPGVVKELAFRVYKLKPLHACVAELSSAGILIANSAVGGPVSASQVIASSIMGTGAAERHRGIHWSVIKDIVLSWIITVPSAAIIALAFHAAIFQWIQKAL